MAEKKRKVPPPQAPTPVTHSYLLSGFNPDIGGIGPVKKLKVLPPTTTTSVFDQIRNASTQQPLPTTAVPPVATTQQSVATISVAPIPSAPSVVVEQDDFLDIVPEVPLIVSQPNIPTKATAATTTKTMPKATMVQKVPKATMATTVKVGSKVTKATTRTTLAPVQRNAIEHVIPLFHQYFERNHVELEVKLGKWNGNSFISGVSKDDFLQFLALLVSYKGWTSSTDWVTMIDYMLPNNVRCTKTSRGNSFIRKSLLEHATVKCMNRPYDLRFSLKEEVPTEVRVPGSPTMVRVKKRRSFVHKGRMQYDLTVVWSGKDEQEAQTNCPTYEIELECINKSNLGIDHQYTATSMLEKMMDFLGRQDPPCVFRAV